MLIIGGLEIFQQTLQLPLQVKICVSELCGSWLIWLGASKVLSNKEQPKVPCLPNYCQSSPTARSLEASLIPCIHTEDDKCSACQNVEKHLTTDMAYPQELRVTHYTYTYLMAPSPFWLRTS